MIKQVDAYTPGRDLSELDTTEELPYFTRREGIYAPYCFFNND